jgi:hypothetical protein
MENRSMQIIFYSNITSFFRFVNKRASYPFGIILLAHAPMNVTDFSIGSINCNPNNPVAILALAGRYINSSSDSDDRGCRIIRVT